MDVSLYEAKNRLSELVKRAEEGEAITLCRHGHAVATLAAIQPAKRKLGLAKGQIREIDKEWWKPLTDEEAEAYEHGRY